MSCSLVRLHAKAFSNSDKLDLAFELIDDPGNKLIDSLIINLYHIIMGHEQSLSNTATSNVYLMLQRNVSSCSIIQNFVVFTLLFSQIMGCPVLRIDIPHDDTPDLISR